MPWGLRDKESSQLGDPWGGCRVWGVSEDKSMTALKFLSIAASSISCRASKLIGTPRADGFLTHIKWWLQRPAESETPNWRLFNIFCCILELINWFICPSHLGLTWRLNDSGTLAANWMSATWWIRQSLLMAKTGLHWRISWTKSFPCSGESFSKLEANSFLMVSSVQNSSLFLLNKTWFFIG